MDKQFGKGAVLRIGLAKRPGSNRDPDGIDFLGFGARSRRIPARTGCGSLRTGVVRKKTTLALQVIAQARERQAGLPRSSDAEHALDPTYRAKTGRRYRSIAMSRSRITGSRLWRLRARSCHPGLSRWWWWIRWRRWCPRPSWTAKWATVAHGLACPIDVAGHAKDHEGVVARTNTCMVFINQVREKIGVMFGNPETTTGGAR